MTEETKAADGAPAGVSDSTQLLDSGVIDPGNQAANMYGCLPCPKCKSEYRWPTQKVHKTHPSTILCDDCGHKEPITNPEYFG